MPLLVSRTVRLRSSDQFLWLRNHAKLLGSTQPEHLKDVAVVILVAAAPRVVMPHSPFDPERLAGLDLPTERLDAGQKIFLVNDDGDCLYVVISGCIEIITVGQQLEAVGPGGIFGEIALVDQGCRSASAMAATDSEVIRISRDAFLELLRHQPTFALHVMAALAARLRRLSPSPDTG